MPGRDVGEGMLGRDVGKGCRERFGFDSFYYPYPSFPLSTLSFAHPRTSGNDCKSKLVKIPK